MDLIQSLFSKENNKFNVETNNESNKEEMYLKYIETIQNKLIDIIEEKNLKIESLEKETNLYYTKYINTKECLEVQLSTNNKLLKIIKNKEDESKKSSFF